ncbi:uncharacterized protein RB166_012662 [Leptodactylus fuscus]|uniref:uncharacterized protein LOC142209901 n=1 Tax=Leptodactylus fuscus TaxID=238119 RepID=UPI003F4E4B9B
MDSYQGFEVGAEVELNDSAPVLEDSPTVIVENKQDLPAWHHLHYIDESSSDESLDHHRVSSTSPENMEILKYLPNVEAPLTWSSQKERTMFSPSEGLYTKPPLHVIERDHPSVLWSHGHHPGQDQTCPLGIGLEETEISHLNTLPALTFSPSPTLPPELYSEMVLSQDGDEAELYGRYSFYNAKTQSMGTVKPWVRSHKCTKCGRQFGRLYNLESHMCIKTALTRVNMGDIMPINKPLKSKKSSLRKKCEQSEESMNRLERMCAEAQRELQNLQELYKKEDKPLLGILLESQEETAQVDESVPDKVSKPKRTYRCERCGRQFRRKFYLGSHVCCSDPLNTNDSVAGHVLNREGPPNSGQDIRPTGQSQDGTEEVKVYKCHYCEKVYNRHASYGTHLRWHMKEKDLVSSVNESLATGDLGPLLTNINMTSLGLKKKTGPTFTCQECGRVFSKQCSYSTHILWHIKRRNSTLTVPSMKQVEERRPPEVQGPSISAEHQAKTVTDNTFTCQECGRVFSKRTAYSSHTRWHKKERELELSFRAQAKSMGHHPKTSSGGSSGEMSTSSHVVDNFEGYSLEQPNLYINEGGTLDNPVDLGQQRVPTEVPEFVFELVVGTESFHQDFTSKDVEETMSRTLIDSLTSTTKEPDETPVPCSLALPNKLLGRHLKRPKPPHRCQDCGACFSESRKLKCHQRKSKSRWKKRRCDCGRSLVGLLHLLRHQLQHLNGTAFICAACGKLLRGYQQLRAHSWVHPLVSQFQCRCGARFTQLPRYLWHSLLNKTRLRRRYKERRCLDT